MGYKVTNPDGLYDRGMKILNEGQELSEEYYKARVGENPQWEDQIEKSRETKKSTDAGNGKSESK